MFEGIISKISRQLIHLEIHAATMNTTKSCGWAILLKQRTHFTILTVTFFDNLPEKLPKRSIPQVIRSFYNLSYIKDIRNVERIKKIAPEMN